MRAPFFLIVGRIGAAYAPKKNSPPVRVGNCREDFLEQYALGLQIGLLLFGTGSGKEGAQFIYSFYYYHFVYF